MFESVVVTPGQRQEIVEKLERATCLVIKDDCSNRLQWARHIEDVFLFRSSVLRGKNEIARCRHDREVCLLVVHVYRLLRELTLDEAAVHFGDFLPIVVCVGAFAQHDNRTLVLEALPHLGVLIDRAHLRGDFVSHRPAGFEGVLSVLLGLLPNDVPERFDEVLLLLGIQQR